MVPTHLRREYANTTTLRTVLLIAVSLTLLSLAMLSLLQGTACSSLDTGHRAAHKEAVVQ